MRRLAFVAGLGALAGALDGAARGMDMPSWIAAAGFTAMLVVVIAGAAIAGVAGLRRAWPSEVPGRALARARLAVLAIGVWAAGMIELADRFAARFSAHDIAALVWACLGVAAAVWLALLVEPAARRLASRWSRPAPPAARRSTRLSIAGALAGAVAIAAALFAVTRSAPADPRSLGAIAARALR